MMIKFEKSPQRKESVLTSIKFTNLGLFDDKNKGKSEKLRMFKKAFYKQCF